VSCVIMLCAVCYYVRCVIMLCVMCYYVMCRVLLCYVRCVIMLCVMCYYVMQYQSKPTSDQPKRQGFVCEGVNFVCVSSFVLLADEIHSRTRARVRKRASQKKRNQRAGARE